MAGNRGGVMIGIRRLVLVLCLSLLWTVPLGCGEGAAKAESEGTGLLKDDEFKDDELRDGAWFYHAFDDRQKRIYDAFIQSAKEPFASQMIRIEEDQDAEGGIPIGEIDTVYQGFMYDHPELFWLAQSYSYRYSGSDENGERADAVAVIPIPDSEEKLAALQEQFDACAGEILTETGGSQSDAEYARSVYTLLAERTEYTGEAMYDDAMQMQHTAYGAIVDKKAVCDGFALAYRYLLSQKGIPCLVIPGESEGSPHTWNTIMWNGTWHEADLTWDASLGNGSKSRYFDLTSSEMQRDHTRETDGIAGLIPVTND